MPERDPPAVIPVTQEEVHVDKQRVESGAVRLRKTVRETVPAAAERGELALSIVRQYGWGGPGACLESMVGVRNALELSGLALVEDRRTGELL